MLLMLLTALGARQLAYRFAVPVVWGPLLFYASVNIFKLAESEPEVAAATGLSNATNATNATVGVAQDLTANMTSWYVATVRPPSVPPYYCDH